MKKTSQKIREVKANLQVNLQANQQILKRMMKKLLSKKSAKYPKLAAIVSKVKAIKSSIKKTITSYLPKKFVDDMKTCYEGAKGAGASLILNIISIVEKIIVLTTGVGTLYQVVISLLCSISNFKTAITQLIKAFKQKDQLIRYNLVGQFFGYLGEALLKKRKFYNRLLI